MGLSHEELMESLQMEQIEPVNNSWIAGRMPPDVSCGIHPAGIREHHTNGYLAQMLVEALPNAMSNPTNAFGKAASINAPSFSPSIPFSLKLS